MPARLVGLEVIHAADRRDHALDRRGEKAAHGLRARAVVDRRDEDRRALDLRILLDRQSRQRPPADEHDDQIDDHREHRVPDENVGERAHVTVLVACVIWRSFPVRSRPASVACAIATSTVSRSLNDPDAATCSPAASPARISTSSPSIAPLCDPARLRAGLAVLVRRDHENVIAFRPLAQRAHGNGDRRLRGADRNPNAHRCAGRRRACGVFDPCAHARVPRRRIDARVERDDLRRGSTPSRRRRKLQRYRPRAGRQRRAAATVKSTCTASSTPCSVVS